MTAAPRDPDPGAPAPRADGPVADGPVAPEGDAPHDRLPDDRVDAYDYDYPPEAVAQVPPARRQDARLLLVRRGQGVAGEGRVAELAQSLREGDLLVLNQAWVRPARLSGVRVATGGRVSILLLDCRGRDATVLLGTRGSLRPHEELEIDGDRWRIAELHGEGRAAIRVVHGRDVDVLADQVGRMPLPPYIRRDLERDAHDELDRERYQTTFARRFGNGRPAGEAAAAAPTAGMHFTPELMAAVKARGVDVAYLTLQVGEGTFRPMRGRSLDEHEMHAEGYVVPEELAAAYARTRERGGRVVAVGTTCVRALESAVRDGGRWLAPGAGTTRLFIRPGHVFAAVDALFTNFHQPRSTLLVLVSAFAGRETIQSAYNRALSHGFRLFSYGDAMLLW